jgi:hypothetical protein
MSKAMEDKYEGNFLEGSDLPEGKRLTVAIEAVVPPGTEKDSSGKVILKAIIAFKGAKKRMILGKTSYGVLKVLFGKDETQWIGKSIDLMRRYLPSKFAFGVHNEMCVRIVPPDGTPLPGKVIKYLGRPTPYPAE